MKPPERAGSAHPAQAPVLSNADAVPPTWLQLVEENERLRLENRVAAERTAILQAVAAGLGKAVTVQDVLETITHEGMRAFRAITSSVYLVSADREWIEAAFSVGVDPENMRQFRRFPVSASYPPAEAMRSMQLIALQSRDEAGARYPHLGEAAKRATARAWVAAPIISGDTAVGALTFGFGEDHQFSVEDRALATALAQHCGLALERTRLFEAERDARAIERFLADVGTSLASSLDYDSTLQRVADAAVPLLADWCILYIAEGNDIRRVALGSTEPEVIELLSEADAQYPMTRASRGAVSRVVNEGSEILLPSFDADFIERSAIDDRHAALLRRLRYQSALIVPLRARGVTIGALLLGTRAGGRTLGQRELTVARRLADKSALAIENARLFRESELIRKAERQARARADEANRAKMEFLAVMSHELRTPLNAIAGYSDLLDLGIHGPLTEDQKESVGRIKRSQRHLLRLINDVLSFAKIDAGHLEIDRRDFVVHDLLAGLEPVVMPQLVQRRLRFVYEPVGRAVTVYADPDKVQQVLLNLLSNAVKFTDAGGTITLGCNVTEETVDIRVTDTGRGIPADKLHRIFEPFVQLDAGKTRVHEGTGLGLSISRDLARAMDGEIEVESALGAGSTFTLILPRGRD